MASIREIEERLVEAEKELKEIIDIIIEVRKEGPENKKTTSLLLEKYLVEMSKYLKEKSKETGDHLSSGINIFKLL